LLEALPGTRLPVPEVMTALSRLWENDPVLPPGKGITDFRASQMNVILHCGLKTTPEELLERFHNTLEMGQRYPCRLIVLCPEPRGPDTDSGDPALESKIFSQCYVGDRGRQHICLEAIFLSYIPSQPGFLENQVSIWLDNDLPTYHWLHRVPMERVEVYGKGFLQRCRKIIFDSSVEPEGYAEQAREREGVPGELSKWRDLAYARGLPLRQSIGQFLSSFEPRLLVEGLQTVVLEHRRNLTGEARCLLGWIRDRLRDCGRDALSECSFELVALPDDAETSLRLLWNYQGSKHFRWWANIESSLAIVEGDLGTGHFSHPQSLRLLAPAESLGEAFFF